MPVRVVTRRATSPVAGTPTSTPWSSHQRATWPRFPSVRGSEMWTVWGIVRWGENTSAIGHQWLVSLGELCRLAHGEAFGTEDEPVAGVEVGVPITMTTTINDDVLALTA